MHLTEEKLKNGMGRKEALKRFLEFGSEIETWVVWNRYTYEVLKEAILDERLQLPKHNVIVLQDMVSFLYRQKRKLGFEYMMNQYGLCYEPYMLHNAKKDAAYLRNLFYKIKYVYIKKCKRNNSQLVSLKKSVVVHTHTCRYVIKKERQQLEYHLLSCLFDGYRLCKSCGHMVRVIRLKRNTQTTIQENHFSENTVRNICKNYEMKCEFCDGIVFIQTPISSWRIYHEQGKIKEIFHKNLRIASIKISRKSNHNVNEGFHIQKLDFDNIYDVLPYIFQHDKRYARNVPHKKNRIEELIEQVAQERLQREQFEQSP